MSMDKSTLIAVLSLTFMLFVQACTGIWWASKITTIQESHTEWILAHQSQQRDYPVLVNRVDNLEKNTAELIGQMRDFLKELRGLKEKSNEDANNSIPVVPRGILGAPEAVDV